VPLAPRTTLGVGGPARWFVEAASEDHVITALAWANAEGIETVVLGGGSNVLVADRGIDALVLSVRIAGIAVEEERAGRVVVRAGAGEPWDAFVERAVGAGWAGLECLSGIPGDVGGTPIQNVGAYGQEVSETIVRVHAIDRRLGARALLERDRCRFAYRDSAFKREDSGRFVVTAVTFELGPGGAPAIRYPELSRHLEATLGGRAPDLADVRAAVIELRRRKSMVIDPADENRRSAGSFFMNPVLPGEAARSVGDRARAAGVLADGEAMPEYLGGPGLTKLSAAWLIERAGFARGTHEGNVGISTRHTLALVNRGGATAAELVAFAARVRRSVLDRFGVALVPEPVMLGFGPGELDALA
jgi:UDP-N-acetylmuramate dehydrogenase